MAWIYLYGFLGINTIQLILAIVYLSVNFRRDPSVRRRFGIMIIRDIFAMVVLGVSWRLFALNIIDGWGVFVISTVCFFPIALLILREGSKKGSQKSKTDANQL